MSADTPRSPAAPGESLEGAHQALHSTLAALVARLRRADEATLAEVKATLTTLASSDNGSRVRDELENLAKGELLEVKWEIEEVIEATTPQKAPPPAPPAPAPAAKPAAKAPARPGAINPAKLRGRVLAKASHMPRSQSGRAPLWGAIKARTPAWARAASSGTRPATESMLSSAGDWPSDVGSRSSWSGVFMIGSPSFSWASRHAACRQGWWPLSAENTRPAG
jgi:hypothetical protein